MKDSHGIILAVILFLGILVIIFEQPEPKLSYSMNFSSPTFENNSLIPVRYSCMGGDVNPPFEISGVPEKTSSLVLIVEDIDSFAKPWIHWVLFNISSQTTFIFENSIPQGAIQGKNSWKRSKYNGPCPPSGQHRYIFTLFALDKEFKIPESSITRTELENDMQGHILSRSSLTGIYYNTYE